MPFKPANYLYSLLIPKYGRAFTLAQLNAIPLAIQEGEYKKIPYSQRKCSCNLGAIEAVMDVLQSCPYYFDIQRNFIESHLKLLPEPSEAFYTLLLLSGCNIDIWYNVAKFLAAAVKIREREVLKII